MFYAERIENNRIAEKGVFLSINEFIPYRRAGWCAASNNNKLADAAIMLAVDEANDYWWFKECRAYSHSSGMSDHTFRFMLAFH